jgi:hypothetical protein
MSRVLSASVIALVCSILLAPAAVIAQEDPKALEKAMWEAWAKHDLAKFEERLAEDHIHVGRDGFISGKAANLADLKVPCEVRSWKLGDMKEQKLGSDAVLLSYEADQDATCGGRKLPAHVYVTVVWKKAGGKWVNASYHDTGAEK